MCCVIFQWNRFQKYKTCIHVKYIVCIHVKYIVCIHMKYIVCIHMKSNAGSIYKIYRLNTSYVHVRAPFTRLNVL